MDIINGAVVNRFNEVVGRSEPSFAVVVAEELDDKTIRKIGAVADAFELRADLFLNRDPNYLAEQSERLIDTLPVLLTIRVGEEEGGWDRSEEDRQKLFSYLLPYVDAIDVEIARPAVTDLVREAHAKGLGAIASSHDFSGTQNEEDLEVIFRAGEESGAEFTKVACSVNTQSELQRLAEFTIRHSEDGVITVAMDKFGPLSRLALPTLGSRLTYAHSGLAVVKGQLGYMETHELLMLSPDYAGLERWAA